MELQVDKRKVKFILHNENELKFTNTKIIEYCKTGYTITNITMEYSMVKGVFLPLETLNKLQAQFQRMKEKVYQTRKEQLKKEK